jgi:hypothetical protein
MKKLFSTVITIIFCALISLAQGQNTRTSVEGNSKTSVSKNPKEVQLESGTQVLAQLQSTLDVRKVKEGDEVLLKTTKDIKSNGEVVVKKGATILGHVTQAQQKSKDKDQSSLSLVFDKLENGALIMPLNATISSVTQAATHAQLDDSMLGVGGSTSSSGGATTRSQGSGGLLGGVTNTVGGVVNTTTQTVGGVVNTTTDTVGRTTGTVGNTLNGLQISQAANATAEGGSTLSLAGNNLRLEKGTSFLLLLNSEAKAEPKAGKKEAKRAPVDNR